MTERLGAVRTCGPLRSRQRGFMQAGQWTRRGSTPRTCRRQASFMALTLSAFNRRAVINGFRSLDSGIVRSGSVDDCSRSLHSRTTHAARSGHTFPTPRPDRSLGQCQRNSPQVPAQNGHSRALSRRPRASLRLRRRGLTRRCSGLATSVALRAPSSASR